MMLGNMPTIAAPRADARPALQLPQIGLGTRLLLAEDCSRVVEQAISIGYRYIDTSPMYGNEAAVGEGVRRAGVAREDMFIATKVERDHLNAEPLRRSVESSLDALKFDHVDLLLIHWPNDAIALAETIRSMCKLQRRGLVRHIGVANFPIAMLDDAIALARENASSIAADQLEIHPSLPQTTVREACKLRDVANIAYSPMGREDLKHPIVAGIASRLDRSPAQVILRWHVQLGVFPIPIPDSGTRDQIAQQFDIFDFELEAEDMQRISHVTPQTRYFSPAWAPKWDASI
jgi:diketogulonate reductase-like aldo/keto reductase